MPHDATIGLGSNLGPRHATIHAGIRDLARVPGVTVVRMSSIIQTDPVGPPGAANQGPYLNAAARLRTILEPRALLDAMLAVERAHGRDRTVEERWGARTLDLDMLTFGDRVVDEDALTVPHPRLAERLFVLIPLAEVASDLWVPDAHRGMITVRRLLTSRCARGEQSASQSDAG